MANTKQLDKYSVLRQLHTPYIVFAADYPDLTIIEQNQAHADVALVKREDVIDRPLLEAFPDTSEEYKKTGVSPLAESIHRVIKAGKPDSMPDLRYDLEDADGKWVERYWSVTHFPLFDEEENVVAVYQETKDITEERIAQQRLKSTSTQLEHILSTSLIGIWSWDIPHGILTADSNLAAMFGVSPEEARAGLPLKTFIDSIHPDDQKRVQKQIDEAVKKGVAYETEYRTVGAGGEIRDVIARGTVQYDDAKKPQIFSGIILDITDRKEAERALRENETRLRFMADAMPQLVWITRPDGYHEYYNKQWYDYTGTKPGSTDGEGWNDLFHPDDQARAWRLWRHSLKTGKPYEIEYRLYHKPSDTYRWVIGRALPLKENGKIIKWYGTCTDIDDQKRTIETIQFLADVSKKLSKTLDYNKMLDTVAKICVPRIADWCSVDLYDEANGFTQASIAHMNPEKIELAREFRSHNPIHVDDPTGVANVYRTGKTELYEITDELLDAYIDDEHRLAFMKSMQLRTIMFVPLKVGKNVAGVMTFVTAESGRHLASDDQRVIEDVAARVSLAMTNSKLYADTAADAKNRRRLEQDLRAEKRKLESRVRERTQQLQLTNQGLMEEIAQRHAVEEQLKRNSEELERSNQELENFAYVASHDLQEPLRKIQAFGNLLQTEYSGSLGEDGGDYISRMQSAAGRMSTLIEDLLEFSRVNRRNEPVRLVDLNEVVSGVLVDLETRIADTGAVVKVGNMPSLHADQTHMRQLFQNLIGNAIKFHHPDKTPHVDVRAHKKGEGVEIQVIDNGIGFDEKYVDRMFSVFQRLHQRASYEGTGIGLAVCRKIVQRYNGTITATSTKGEGATFTLWLPVKKGTK